MTNPFGVAPQIQSVRHQTSKLCLTGARMLMWHLDPRKFDRNFYIFLVKRLLDMVICHVLNKQTSK
jgi:hypothetical protein